MSGNEILVAILEHHKWSNLAMIDFCATLTDEQLSLAVPGTRGNVRDTIQHIIGNEVAYLSFMSDSGIRLCSLVAGLPRVSLLPLLSLRFLLSRELRVARVTLKPPVHQPVLRMRVLLLTVLTAH